MNLVEVTQIINHPEVDDEMKALYRGKREELVGAINVDLSGLGLASQSLKQLLLNSSHPALAETL